MANICCCAKCLFRCIYYTFFDTERSIFIKDFAENNKTYLHVHVFYITVQNDI